MSEGFVRPFVVELFDEGVEGGLLLKEIGSGGDAWPAVSTSGASAHDEPFCWGWPGRDAFDRNSEA